MKKMYVSPEMNVEAFVANDYVAACWVITCTSRGKHGNKLVTGSSLGDVSGLYTSSETSGYYVGSINGRDPDFFEGTTGLDNIHYSHPVSITPGADGGAKELNPDHPNASN